MAAPAIPAVSPAPISSPLRDVLPWAVFAGVLLYIVGLEQGATSLVGGHYVHELVHDARHLLSFPCH